MKERSRTNRLSFSVLWFPIFFKGNQRDCWAFFFCLHRQNLCVIVSQPICSLRKEKKPPETMICFLKLYACLLIHWKAFFIFSCKRSVCVVNFGFLFMMKWYEIFFLFGSCSVFCYLLFNCVSENMTNCVKMKKCQPMIREIAWFCDRKMNIHRNQ